MKARDLKGINTWLTYISNIFWGTRIDVGNPFIAIVSGLEIMAETENLELKHNKYG